jgi:hypothetical protein
MRIQARGAGDLPARNWRTRLSISAIRGRYWPSFPNSPAVRFVSAQSASPDSWVSCNTWGQPCDRGLAGFGRVRKPPDRVQRGRLDDRSLPLCESFVALDRNRFGHISPKSRFPDIYIWDVLKRPNYAAAYGRMVSGEKRLPEWIATPDQLARSVTTSAGSVLSVGGNTEEVFSMCKAHECDSKTFVIFFSQFGDVAKGILRVNGSLRFLGYPTSDERSALISNLSPQ